MLSRPERSWAMPAPSSNMAARLPRTRTSPDVGLRMPATHLSRVDLPEPLRPRIPKVVPSSISTLTSFRAQKGTKGMRPPWSTRSFMELYFSLYRRKRLERSETSMAWAMGLQLLGEVAFELPEDHQGEQEEPAGHEELDDQ